MTATTKGSRLKHFRLKYGLNVFRDQVLGFEHRISHSKSGTIISCVLNKQGQMAQGGKYLSLSELRVWIHVIAGDVTGWMFVSNNMGELEPVLPEEEEEEASP